MRWYCVARDHSPLSFDLRDAFIQHMNYAHPGKFRKEQLPYIANSSAHALDSTIPACPFCSEISGNMEEHVAQHLQYFALQSLPWPDCPDLTSDDGSGPINSPWSSDQGDRETLEDTFEDIPPTVSTQDDQMVNPGVTSSPDILADVSNAIPPLMDETLLLPTVEKVFPQVDHVLEEFAAAQQVKTDHAKTAHNAQLVDLSPM